MAIYHFSAKVISCANGSSAVASAAYRAAERLHDDRLWRDHDFSNKAGVVYSEILAPEGAPERLNDLVRRSQARERQRVGVRALTSWPTCPKKGSIAAVMAIYHFAATVISRASGSRAVASAAYRAAERLHDDRLGRDHDFSNKAGVVHSEILAPEGAPERLNDRATLWNEVEAGEKRKDAQ